MEMEKQIKNEIEHFRGNCRDMIEFYKDRKSKFESFTKRGSPKQFLIWRVMYADDETALSIIDQLEKTVLFMLDDGIKDTNEMLKMFKDLLRLSDETIEKLALKKVVEIPISG